MSKPSTFGLFLGDLSLFCNEEDLRVAFQPFGSLVEVRIKRSKENKKNLSYGFVEFLSPIDAIRAMQAMDGKLLCGRALKVRWASKKQAGIKVGPTEKMPKDAPGTASIYVSFSCFNVMGDITEETLRADFQKYGEVMDVTIKYSTHDEQTGMQKGYGFVSYKEDYEGYASVLAALGELANATVGNVSYKCELSRASKMLLEQHDPVPSVSPFAGNPSASAFVPSAPNSAAMMHVNSVLSMNSSFSSMGVASLSSTSNAPTKMSSTSVSPREMWMQGRSASDMFDESSSAGTLRSTTSSHSMHPGMSFYSGRSNSSSFTLPPRHSQKSPVPGAGPYAPDMSKAYNVQHHYHQPRSPHMSGYPGVYGEGHAQHRHPQAPLPAHGFPQGRYPYDGHFPSPYDEMGHYSEHDRDFVGAYSAHNHRMPMPQQNVSKFVNSAPPIERPSHSGHATPAGYSPASRLTFSSAEFNGFPTATTSSPFLDFDPLNSLEELR
eukprot:gene12310-8803_t